MKIKPLGYLAKKTIFEDLNLSRMKKILLLCLIFLLPCIAIAQEDAPLTDDYYDDIRSLAGPVKIDDHTSVIQVNTGTESFDLMAINDKQEIVWHTTIDGYGMAMGKFKGKIVAVASTEHSAITGTGNTYKAFMLAPLTGKVLTSKIVYEDSNDYIEVPQILIGDNYFKFAMRETNITHRLHVGIPIVAIFQVMEINKEGIETQKLDVVDLNEKLEPISTIKPAINGTFITISCNKRGDMFVAWLNGPDIEVYKYPAGKSDPSGKLNADVTINGNSSTNLAGKILFTASDNEPDNLYYSMLYRNEDKEPEMMLGKLDFAANTKKSVTQVFQKADLKALEKGFIPVNKKLDDPDLGSPKSMGIESLVKTDGGLVVAMESTYTVVSNYGSQCVGMSLLLNGFDDDLKPKFQQVLPNKYAFPNVRLTQGFHEKQGKLCVVANNKGVDTQGMYGVLDLKTGQWDNMYFLTDKKIKGFLEADNILWFGNGFVAPYLKLHGMFTAKFNLSMQLNSY